MNTTESPLQLFKTYKWNIIFIAVIIVLSVVSIKSINSYIDQKNTNSVNLVALTDSIKYYKGKNNELVATKTTLEVSYNDLKIANEELYNKLKSMKVTNPEATVGVSTIIENELHDTIWYANSDSVVKSFDFSNKYRELSGMVWKHDSILGLNFTKDIINFDYTVAFKDNQVYISSDNPYVKYNSITGYTIPKEKTKRWSVGPSITIGYDPVHNTFSPVIGASITYGLIRW